MAEQLRDGLDVPIRGVEDALPPRGDEGYRPFKACAGLALLVFAATAVAAGALASSGSLILPTHTPGAHYSAVAQQTLSSTVCRSGWTRKVRPPPSYTNALKRTQLAEFHYADQNRAHYEEDHLISLELGGAPRLTRNLWPQPWSQARRDDNGIESRLHRQLCNWTLTLRQAQEEIAYKHRLG
jgi:hypothetical protein